MKHHFELCMRRVYPQNVCRKRFSAESSSAVRLDRSHASHPVPSFSRVIAKNQARKHQISIKRQLFLSTIIPNQIKPGTAKKITVSRSLARKRIHKKSSCSMQDPLKVIGIHLHQTHLKVTTQTDAFLGPTSCFVKQVSILSVSILAPPCTNSYRRMQSYSSCAGPLNLMWMSIWGAEIFVAPTYRSPAKSIWKVVPLYIWWGLVTRARVTVVK